MVLEGQDVSYEIVQTLPEEGGNIHYRCRLTEPEGGFCHLAGVPLGEGILSLVARWQENPAFSDLRGYLIWEDRIYLEFPDAPGSGLADVLGLMTAVQRFGMGQQMMEQFLVQDMPPCLQWDLARQEAVRVQEDGSETRFYYLTQNAEDFGDAGRKQANSQLFRFFHELFPEEICKEYPEAADFLEKGKEWEDAGLMAIYTEYLGLLPAFSRAADKEEEKEKEPLLERLKRCWKKWGKKALSALKVALGIMTLCAALILLPEVWEEKLKPVVDGAVLWKRVYVDGETLPEEEESEEAPGEDAGEDSAGRKTLYWENGGIRYQGGIQDDKYEGSGTLYYADGTTEYQGEFAFGKKEGTGILYTEAGQVLYEGQFHNDRYEGEGRLYDKEYGSLVYEGGFKSGRYSGEGTLYQPLSDFPLYVGGFRLGHYDGEGLEYDENGCMRYEGNFLLGVYHGDGAIYDPETGIVLFAGAFRNGMPVLTDETAGTAEDGMAADGILADGVLDDGSVADGGMGDGSVHKGGLEAGNLPDGAMADGEAQGMAAAEGGGSGGPGSGKGGSNGPGSGGIDIGGAQGDGSESGKNESDGPGSGGAGTDGAQGDGPGSSKNESDGPGYGGAGTDGAGSGMIEGDSAGSGNGGSDSAGSGKGGSNGSGSGKGDTSGAESSEEKDGGKFPLIGPVGENEKPEDNGSGAGD